MNSAIEDNSIRRIQRSELHSCFSFWDFENDLEKRAKIEREIENKIRIMYAYILDDKYIAGMSLSPIDNRTIYLSYLAVSEEYRNKGIGTKMIRYACQTAKDEGYSYIALNVDNDNTKAKRLYKRIGFVVIGKNRERTEMRIDL